MYKDDFIKQIRHDTNGCFLNGCFHESARTNLQESLAPAMHGYNVQAMGTTRALCQSPARPVGDSLGSHPFVERIRVGSVSPPPGRGTSG